MSGGFGSGSQVERRITDLERGARTQGNYDSRITTVENRTANGVIGGFGSVTLAASPATSTVKTDAHVTASSLIFLCPATAGAWSIDAGITGLTIAAGQFTVSHSASSLARTFNYVIVNPTP